MKTEKKVGYAPQDPSPLIFLLPSGEKRQRKNNKKEQEEEDGVRKKKEEDSDMVQWH